MPAEELQLAAERIERFRRLGGVELDPDDIGLRHRVWAGTEPLKKTRFTFRCTLCGRIERLETEMEPVCTGPLWTDDHPMAVMVRVLDP